LTTPEKRFSSRGATTEHRKDLPAKSLSPSDRKLIKWGRRSGRRDGENGILLEGIKLIEEALDAGHPLTRTWYTPEVAETNPVLIGRLAEHGVNLREVDQRLMRSISDLESPPGISAVAPQPGFIHCQPGDPFSLIVAVSKLQDPGNLGGLIRSADYFGVNEIWLGQGSVDPYNSKVIRGSMGALFRMPVLKRGDLREYIGRFKSMGATVWAAVAHDDKARRKIDPSGSRILLIGGESGGLSREYLELADEMISIPGARRSESLNLAVAAGILIYSATSGRY